MEKAKHGLSYLTKKFGKRRESNDSKISSLPSTSYIMTQIPWNLIEQNKCFVQPFNKELCATSYFGLVYLRHIAFSHNTPLSKCSCAYSICPPFQEENILMSYKFHLLICLQPAYFIPKFRVSFKKTCGIIITHVYFKVLFRESFLDHCSAVLRPPRVCVKLSCYFNEVVFCSCDSNFIQTLCSHHLLFSGVFRPFSLGEVHASENGTCSTPRKRRLSRGFLADTVHDGPWEPLTIRNLNVPHIVLSIFPRRDLVLLADVVFW